VFSNKNFKSSNITVNNDLYKLHVGFLCFLLDVYPTGSLSGAVQIKD